MIANWATVDRTDLKKNLRDLTGNSDGGVLAVIGDDWDARDRAADVSVQFLDSQGFNVLRVYEPAHVDVSVKALLIQAWRQLEPRPHSGTIAIPASTARGRNLGTTQVSKIVADLACARSLHRPAFVFDTIDRLRPIKEANLACFMELANHAGAPVVLMSRKQSATYFPRSFQKFALDNMDLDEVILSLKTGECFRQHDTHRIEELVCQVTNLGIDGKLIAQDVYQILQEGLK